jgi:hypothetical protein
MFSSSEAPVRPVPAQVPAPAGKIRGKSEKNKQTHDFELNF